MTQDEFEILERIAIALETIAEYVKMQDEGER